MKEVQVISDDEFVTRFFAPEGDFSLDDHLIDQPEEVQAALEMRTLWTMLDCDGDVYLAPGWHYVNRLDYVRAKVPWTPEEEATLQVLWSKDEEAEDG